MVLRVEDLDIYQMAEELSDRVWEICIKWDYFAKDTIGKQLVRSMPIRLLHIPRFSVRMD